MSETTTRGWLRPAILAAAGLSVASGYASFGVTAALGDVATAFGEPDPGDSVAAMAGMAGTTVGLGLAIIRLASLGALPLAGLADRVGRRRVIITSCLSGLAVTITTAATPTYWWFVAVFALARPLLAATNALAAVIAAEETRSVDRSKAIALVTGSYAFGAGLTALVRPVLPAAWGFRGLFASVVVPLVVVAVVTRWLHEPDRYEQLTQAVQTGAVRARLGAVRADLRPRLALLCLLHMGFGFVTGPFTTNLFLYGENVLAIGSGMMAVIVVGAGAAGLLGLLAGRWAADRLGRRVSAGGAMALVALTGPIIYGGSPVGLAVGYIAAVIAAAAYTPAAGALDAELFPTSTRATAGGWITAANIMGAVLGLLAFGVLIDAYGGFRPAALTLAVPAVALAGLYALLPETRGMELEESAPEA